jgi:hypothetical protein
MLSESARMMTAEQARFRINYPNSKPRATKIVALDEESAETLKSFAGFPWNGARFLTFVSATSGGEGLEDLPVDATLVDVDGKEVRLTEELKGADMVAMVTSEGKRADAAAAIGNACLVRGIMTTGMILPRPGAEEEVTRTLKALRPYAHMLVVASDTDYIPEMLTALRA